MFQLHFEELRIHNSFKKQKITEIKELMFYVLRNIHTLKFWRIVILFIVSQQ